MIAKLLASSGFPRGSKVLGESRSVFYTKILPHILEKNSQGVNSIIVIEQEGTTITGLVVPELVHDYPRIIADSKGNGFQTTVKIWEEGHICPPFYNIHIKW
jgi:hypothetical protein